jgi:hypothetical protein
VSAARDEIAEMIADWFGRSVIDADRDLADQILAKLGPEKPPVKHRDPTYGWRTDELA